LAPSSDDSNQLQPSPKFPITLQQKPATLPVKAVSGVLGDIGDNAITGRAEYIRQNTDEEMISVMFPTATGGTSFTITLPDEEAPA
jgi:hypothetical protein